MRSRLLSPWLTVRLQFVLAAFFVVAGVSKIVDPPGFAHEIHNYQLVPGVAVNAEALVLPWLEVVLGGALFLGIWTRTATRILAFLLVVFIAALSINLARGRPVDCGCFGTSAVPKTTEQRLFDMKVAIARDVGLLLLAAQILAAERERQRRR
ncbi:MAG TPA: MauE/DoxX family redox-associated membrane protein [Thermoanaerobaculia bacterium]